MADTTEIRRALSELPAGTEVELKLRDGSHVTATIDGGTAHRHGDGGGEVDVNSIERVFLEASSAGPE